MGGNALGPTGYTEGDLYELGLFFHFGMPSSPGPMVLGFLISVHRERAPRSREVSSASAGWGCVIMQSAKTDETG